MKHGEQEHRLLSLNHPLAAVHDVLEAHIGGYSVLQLGLGAAAVVGVVWAIRKLAHNALGSEG